MKVLVAAISIAALFNICVSMDTEDPALSAFKEGKTLILSNEGCFFVICTMAMQVITHNRVWFKRPGMGRHRAFEDEFIAIYCETTHAQGLPTVEGEMVNVLMWPSFLILFWNQPQREYGMAS